MTAAPPPDAVPGSSELIFGAALVALWRARAKIAILVGMGMGAGLGMLVDAPLDVIRA